MVYELSRLPTFERVVFINPRTFYIGEELRCGRGTVRERAGRILRALPPAHEGKTRICTQLRFVPLKRYFPQGYRLEDWIFRGLIDRLRGKMPFVLLNNHPNFFSKPLLLYLMKKASLTVFDISDDFVEFFEEKPHRDLFRRNMQFCCTHSDVVLTINEHLKEKYGKHNPSTYVVSNGTNFENFDKESYRKVPFLEKVRSVGEPILGYTGIINRFRLDYELLEELLKSKHRWQFVFVGSAEKSFMLIVEKYPNLHYHPQVPYRVLPDWIEYFDAAIIPFRVNEHTRGNDLLKFNDYLAMGKSVVTTDMGGARKYEALLRIATGTEGFLEAIDQAVDDNAPEIRRRRKECARENSWNRKIDEVHSIILDHLRVAMPEAGR